MRRKWEEEDREETAGDMGGAAIGGGGDATGAAGEGAIGNAAAFEVNASNEFEQLEIVKSDKLHISTLESGKCCEKKMMKIQSLSC